MISADELTRGLDQLRDSITQTAQVAPQVARQEIHREGRAYFRGAVVASVITSLLVGVPLALLANQFSEHANTDAVRATQSQSQAQNMQRLVQSAHDLGVAANAKLARRGLTPVLIPKPGNAPDSQVLLAASTAQIAAKIASQSVAAPTPAQIQAEVAAALVTLPPPPVGPASQQLNEAVQAYVAANAQGLRGSRGESGAPGKSPPCLAEPTQCQGPRGEPPMGWTIEQSDGSTTTCERVAAFDPTVPRYRCSRVTSSPSAAAPPRRGAGPSPSPRR
jgi:hypothetical protein